MNKINEISTHNNIELKREDNNFQHLKKEYKSKINNIRSSIIVVSIPRKSICR